MLCNIGGGLLSVLENQLNFILIGLEEKVNAKTKAVIIFRKKPLYPLVFLQKSAIV
jgi:hypothetical protein